MYYILPLVYSVYLCTHAFLKRKVIASSASFFIRGHKTFFQSYFHLYAKDQQHYLTLPVGYNELHSKMGAFLSRENSKQEKNLIWVPLMPHILSSIKNSMFSLSDQNLNTNHRHVH